MPISKRRVFGQSRPLQKSYSDPADRLSREDRNADKLFNAMCDGDVSKVSNLLAQFGFDEKVELTREALAREEQRLRQSMCKEAAQNSFYYASFGSNIAVARALRQDGINMFAAYMQIRGEAIFIKDTFYRSPLRNLRLLESIALSIDHYMGDPLSPIMCARHLNMSYDADAIGDVALISTYGPRICIAEPDEYDKCIAKLAALDAPSQAINYILKERNFFHESGIRIQ